jgi:hypothetical protein
VTTFVEQVARTRRQDTRDDANVEAENHKLNERQRLARRREANRIAWITYYESMAESHKQIAAEHESKALALLEDVPGA